MHRRAPLAWSTALCRRSHSRSNVLDKRSPGPAGLGSRHAQNPFARASAAISSASAKPLGRSIARSGELSLHECQEHWNHQEQPSPGYTIASLD
jgi:hypothetical protein